MNTSTTDRISKTEREITRIKEIFRWYLDAIKSGQEQNFSNGFNTLLEETFDYGDTLNVLLPQLKAIELQENAEIQRVLKTLRLSE